MAKDINSKYLSKPIEARMSLYSCFCGCCNDKPSEDDKKCDRISRLSGHTGDVNRLLLACPDIVTLLVGPTEVKVTCHKALLGFTSEFFDAALYGHLEESQTNIIRLPEERPEAVAGFLTWVYSGHIESPVVPEELYTLGHRLRSPKFMNEVMYLLFAIYGRHERWLSARGADFAFNQTPPDSNLRLFVAIYAHIHGPLCLKALKTEKHYDKNGAYKTDWIIFISEGSDLVLKMAEGEGARKYPNSYKKFGLESLAWLDQLEFILDVTPRNIEDIIQGKARAD